MKKRTMRTVAGIGPTVAGIAKCALVGVWLAPAFAVNLNWGPSGSLSWNLAAAGAVVASAVIFEAARHQKSRLTLAAMVLFGALLLFANIANGFRNAVTRSGDMSDHRRGEIETASREKDLHHRLAAGRIDAVAIAGEAPAALYRADVDRRKTANAHRWRATRGCDPTSITLPESQAFCADIAARQARFEAAKRRDEIDAQLVPLDLRREGAAAPSSADPFADAAVQTLSIAGLTLTPASVRTFFDALWSIIPEMLAALMPAVTLSIFSRQEAPGRPPEAQHRPLAKREKRADATDAESNPFQLFVNDELESVAGARLSPADVLGAWNSWNMRQGRTPEPMQWLGRRLGKAFAFEEKHKRKVYLNVRLKQQPHLRLVSAESQGASVDRQRLARVVRSGARDAAANVRELKAEKSRTSPTTTGCAFTRSGLAGTKPI